MRKQTEERICFSYEQKEKILAKSDGKCCHCGRKLALTDKNYEKITVEHVIPISKGGTNDDINLVALCEDCNKKKSNMVIHPLDYFTHLNKEDSAELQKYYDAYCEDISWFSTHCYTREDALSVFYKKPIEFWSDHKPKATRKNYEAQASMNASAILKRCTIEDLPEIYDYVIRYNKKMDISGSDDVVRDSVDDVFRKGCIYKVYNNSNIIAVIPFMIGQILVNGSLAYSFMLRGLPILYQKDYYFLLIHDCLHYIIDCLSYLNGYKAVCIRVSVAQKDQFAQRIIKSLNAYEDEPIQSGNSEEKEFCNYTISVVLSKKEEIGDDLDPDKVTLAASRGIERGMHLKTIAEFQKPEEEKKNFFATNENLKKANKTLKKNARREEVDEYDPKYYGFN